MLIWGGVTVLNENFETVHSMLVTISNGLYLFTSVFVNLCQRQGYVSLEVMVECSFSSCFECKLSECLTLKMCFLFWIIYIQWYISTCTWVHVYCAGQIAINTLQSDMVIQIIYEDTYAPLMQTFQVIL